MHAGDDHANVTVGILGSSGNRVLRTLSSQIMGESIVDLKDLTLSMTLGLDGKLNQILISGSASSTIKARGHACIQASSRDPSSVSAGHLGFHAADFIEAIESNEGDELLLVVESDIYISRGSAILTHVGEDVSV